MADDYIAETLTKAISEALEPMQAENSELRESLADVQRMFQLDDINWKLMTGFNSETEGLDLEEVKEISKRIRPYMVGASLIKRGADLRIGYVWGKGMRIEGVKPSGTAGRNSLLQTFYANKTNQDALFTAGAHAELEKGAYSDGAVLAICDKSARTARRIPMHEVSGILVNPDFPEEVWAYQRQWVPDSTKPQTQKTLWYYTNRFSGTKTTSIKDSGGQSVPVAKGQIIVDKRFNRQVGWPLGVPDATAAFACYVQYSEFIKSGKSVSDAMAKLIYKVTNKTTGGVQNAAAKIAGMRGSGNTASMLDGQDLTPIATAGKGYDFNSGRPLASLIAASLNVSVVALLADPGAAGSSYGSAQTLEPPTINAMRYRQQEWVEWYSEVFEACIGTVPVMTFDEIIDADPYRDVQSTALAWGMGLLWDDEARPDLLDALKIASKHTSAPDGFMYPNNKNSKARIDIDPNGAAFGSGDATSKQAASPDQGQNSAGGQAANVNDLRKDTIANALNSINLDRLEILVERLENANRGN